MKFNKLLPLIVDLETFVALACTENQAEGNKNVRVINDSSGKASISLLFQTVFTYSTLNKSCFEIIDFFVCMHGLRRFKFVCRVK